MRAWATWRRGSPRAWADREPQPFVPSRFSVCSETGEYQGGPDRVLDSLPQAAQDIVRPLDWTHEQVGSSGALGMPFDIWCSTVTTEQARALARTFDDAGLSVLEDRAPELAYRSESQLEVAIAFVPLLPHQR